MKNLIETDFDKTYKELSSLFESVDLEELLEEAELDESYIKDLRELKEENPEYADNDSFMSFSDFITRLPAVAIVAATDKENKLDLQPYYNYLLNIFNKRGRCPDDGIDDVVDSHHIVFRSFGGDAAAWDNQIALGRHEHIEAHRLFAVAMLNYVVAHDANATFGKNKGITKIMDTATSARSLLDNNTWWHDDLDPEEVHEVLNKLAKSFSDTLLTVAFKDLFNLYGPNWEKDNGANLRAVGSEKGAEHNFAEHGYVYFPYEFDVQATASKEQIKSAAAKATINFEDGHFAKSAIDMANAIKPGSKARKISDAYKRAQATHDDLLNDTIPFNLATYRKAFGWKGDRQDWESGKTKPIITAYFFMFADDLDLLKAKAAKEGKSINVKVSDMPEVSVPVDDSDVAKVEKVADDVEDKLNQD